MDTNKGLRCALVSMPWAQPDRPSGALAALKPYIEENRPSVQVDVFSEYVKCARSWDLMVYRLIADACYRRGEPIYASLFYPAISEQIKASWIDSMVDGVPVEGVDFAAAFDELASVANDHAQELAEVLVGGGYDVVGFSICFGQFFASLLVARELKRIAPHLTVVFGGSSVSSSISHSVTKHFPFVDHVIRGEGERLFVELIDRIQAGDTFPSTAPAQTDGDFVEERSLDALPVPDYDEYASVAGELEWVLPLEGSRGCWWDRARKTKNPKQTCYFCNLNMQWNGYREKSVERIVTEVEKLANRHQKLNVYFLDNIIRNKQIEHLGERLEALGVDLEFFYEARVNLTGAQIWALHRAGLKDAQFGIEALTTPLLNKMGKGTRAIQNLFAMKVCFELGIGTGANLIAELPGSTEQDVEETVQAIERFAMPFEPCQYNPFHLGIDSTFYRLAAEFGISGIRPASWWTGLFPDPATASDLAVDFDFDVESPPDWSPVRDACTRWKKAHEDGDPPRLTYRDGGSFLVLDDQRNEERQEFVLEREEKEVYLYCCEIRKRPEILRRFASLKEARVIDMLDAFEEHALVFREGASYLSMATAPDARRAAMRIEAQARKPARAVYRLPVAN